MLGHADILRALPDVLKRLQERAFLSEYTESRNRLEDERVVMIVYIHQKHTPAGTPGTWQQEHQALEPWYYKTAVYHYKVFQNQIKHVVVVDIIPRPKVVQALVDGAGGKKIRQIMINAHGLPGLVLPGRACQVRRCSPGVS